MEFQGILFAFVLINILNMNNSNNNQIIRFDWAMKRLLRNKANFSVLEGLLTTLPGEKIVKVIRRISLTSRYACREF